MPLYEEAVSAQRAINERSYRVHRPPEGWEPGVEFDTVAGRGTIVVPHDEDPVATLADTLGITATIAGERYNLEPDGFRKWEAVTKEGVRWLHYFRFKVTPRLLATSRLDDLFESIRREKPRKVTPPAGGDRTLVVCPADWQAGKGDGGGPEALHGRVLALEARLAEHTALLRKVAPVESCVLAIMGDMVENVQGHYPAQQFKVSLGLTDQLDLAGMLLGRLVKQCASLFREVIVLAVPGNHSEVRGQEGKAVTDWATDNFDIHVLNMLGYGFGLNPDRYGHVVFHRPQVDPMSVAFTQSGTTLGFTHGHQVKGAATAEQVWKWWDAQAGARTNLGDVTCLVTAHRHHFQAMVQGRADGSPRWWLQAPSLDGDSEWFRQRTGNHTLSSTLTFVVGDGQVDWVRVL